MNETLTTIKGWQHKVRDPWTKAVEDPVTACMNLLDRALYWQLDWKPATSKAFRTLAGFRAAGQEIVNINGAKYYHPAGVRKGRCFSRTYLEPPENCPPTLDPYLVPEEAGAKRFWELWRVIEREHEEEYRAKGETAELVREGWWLRFLR
jgi:hypothetical protein